VILDENNLYRPFIQTCLTNVDVITCIRAMAPPMASASATTTVPRSDAATAGSPSKTEQKTVKTTRSRRDSGMTPMAWREKKTVYNPTQKKCLFTCDCCCFFAFDKRFAAELSRLSGSDRVGQTACKRTQQTTQNFVPIPRSNAKTVTVSVSSNFSLFQVGYIIRAKTNFPPASLLPLVLPLC
jgi:hypothetical protein